MNKDRNYILDRLKSRNVSIDEFNFDNLKAPPLSMFLTPNDIQELNSIALSLKLSAKPELRYKMIDQVMRRRGLVKFLSGTNRVTYRHPEFPNILFKVASDAVGIRDNPAEFYNQNLLKPFVTKIFEVSPGGVVAITERVNPITSREEFISVADDIFELITEWLVGEYVLADFGSTFFMNYGIRSGFGCVILDYPYLYKLDGNKLYCNKPDTSSASGKCDGIIDYDAGYNFLHCTKCGAIYKAKELEQKIKNNEIINLDEGEKKMEVIIKGGSKDLKERTIKTMDVDNPNFAESLISVSHLGEKMENSIKKAVETTEKTVVSSTNIGNTEYKFEVVTSRSKISENKEKESVKPIVEDKKVDLPNVPVAPIVTEEVSPIITVEKSSNEDVEMSVNGVNPNAKVAESPIIISPAVKKKFEEQGECDREPSPVETAERAIARICRCINEIDIDIVKEDILERSFIAITSMLPNNNKSIKWLLSAIKDIIDADPEDNLDEDSINTISSIASYFGLFYHKDAELEKIKNYVDKLTAENEKLIAEVDKLKDLIINNKDSESEEMADEEVPEKFTKDSFIGIRIFGAVTTDIAELLPTHSESQKIIALLDEDNKYVAIDNYMVAINELDGHSIDNMELVSKEYLDDLTRISDIVMNSGHSDEESNDSIVHSSNDSNDETVDRASAMGAAINLATQKFLEDEEKMEV